MSFNSLTDSDNATYSAAAVGLVNTTLFFGFSVDYVSKHTNYITTGWFPVYNISSLISINIAINNIIDKIALKR